MRFSSTPRGARLARHLCGQQLDAWGIAYGTEAHDALVLIASELCANAVRHGRVVGRDFRVRLTFAPGVGAVRIEVTDTREEALPALRAGEVETEGGRGLLLVEALADRWGCSPRVDGGPGKTVWAERGMCAEAEARTATSGARR